MFGLFKSELPTQRTALPGRDELMPLPPGHFVHGRTLQAPFPAQCEQILLAMGCFWGAERMFWQLPGVYSTAVGYAGGFTANPTYEEVCSGGTGHTEAVLVVYDPQQVELADILKTFWQGHDPTQGMRQGNDHGSQYRSAVYAYSEQQLSQVQASAAIFQEALNVAGYGQITSELSMAGEFYYAEHYHQQYLAKVPNGYCGLGGTGVGCDLGALGVDL
ncbi:MAG: peptide-methionine (S)-S-oxide reductase MsrA [Candidatus Azotimanducaceae bacterium]